MAKINLVNERLCSYSTALAHNTHMCVLGEMNCVYQHLEPPRGGKTVIQTLR